MAEATSRVHSYVTERGIMIRDQMSRTQRRSGVHNRRGHISARQTDCSPLRTLSNAATRCAPMATQYSPPTTPRPCHISSMHVTVCHAHRPPDAPPPHQMHGWHAAPRWAPSHAFAARAAAAPPACPPSVSSAALPAHHQAGAAPPPPPGLICADSKPRRRPRPSPALRQAHSPP